MVGRLRRSIEGRSPTETPQESSTERTTLAQNEISALARELVEQGVPDAMMLRRVIRVRALMRAVDSELEGLQRYFTGSAEAQIPPS